MVRRLSLAVAALSIMAATAHAGTIVDPGAAGFTPMVPVSALGTLGSWFDPSRLHMTSTFEVGSAFGTSSALNITSFSYQFHAPLSMSVSVGNAFGPGSASGSSTFLEGLDMSYKPSNNMMLRIQYRDLRSPLQYGYGGYGAFDRGFWGY